MLITQPCDPHFSIDGSEESHEPINESFEAFLVVLKMASHYQQMSWSIWSFINLNTIPYNMLMSNHWVPVVIAKSTTANLFTHHNPPPKKKQQKKQWQPDKNDSTSNCLELRNHGVGIRLLALEARRLNLNPSSTSNPVYNI